MSAPAVDASITRPAPDVAVVRVHEPALNLSVKEAFRGLLKNQMAEGATRIVIDLTEVSFCDSSGLSALIHAHRQAVAREGWVRLVGVSSQLERLLEVSNLQWLLRRFATVDAALDD